MSHVPFPWFGTYPEPTFAIAPERCDLPDLGCELDDDEPTRGGGARVRDVFIERGAELDARAREPLFRLRRGMASDVGRQRRQNEDAVLVLEDENLFAVADGMGGHNGGAIASQLAVDAMTGALQEDNAAEPIDPNVPEQAAAVLRTFAAANAAVRLMASRNPNFAEMGTTIVAAHFLPKSGRVCIAHVGDSRCYRLRGGTLAQLTRDHTVGTTNRLGQVAERLTRAVGPRGVVEADIAVVAPRERDVFLLCSDGLSKMLSQREIRATLEAFPDPDACATELVEKANRAGGTDNVSAIVILVEPASSESS